MAIGFLVCVAPDEHISYLRQRPGLVQAYLDGVPPAEAGSTGPLPAWWPAVPPEALDSWNLNDRNPDLYHEILNGGPALVSGAGSIFQSWFAPDHPAAFFKLDGYNERFAFDSSQLAELATLVAGVNVDSVLKAFIEWCKRHGKGWENLDVYACEPFVEEFRAFGDLLDDALRDGHGIIW